MSFLTSPKQCFTLCLDRGEGGLCVSGVWKLMSYHGDLKKQCDRCPPPQSSVPPSIHFHLEQNLLPEKL